MTTRRLTVLQQLMLLIGVALTAIIATSVATQEVDAATLEAPFDASHFFAWEQDLIGTGPGLNDLNLPAVHALSTGSGVTIAVLDTGFDLDDPSIAGRLVTGFDFVDGDADPSEAPNGIDDDLDGEIDEATGHGSYVADVIAQVSPDAIIMPVRVLDAEGLGTVQDVVAGIEWAGANGADIINLSFGSLDDIAQVRQAIEALPLDIVVVAAAGNNMDSARRYPAAISRVTSVAAFDLSTNRLAAFSTTGNWIDVSAPGLAVRSNLAGSQTIVWSGTSAATPIVSANYALIKAINPAMDSTTLQRTLFDASHREPGSRHTSRGVVDPLQSLQGSRVISCVQQGETLMVTTERSPWKVRIEQAGQTIATVSDGDLTGVDPIYTSADPQSEQEYVARIWSEGANHSASCVVSENTTTPTPKRTSTACVDGDHAVVYSARPGGHLSVYVQIRDIGAIAPGFITDDVVAIDYKDLTDDLRALGAVPDRERFGGIDGSHDVFEAKLTYSGTFIRQSPVSEFKVTLFFAGVSEGVDVCFTPTFYVEY